jgi:hypothetical protein
MAQMNPTVGDLSGNLHRITTWIRDAKKVNADLVVFPELAITGSPPEDLLLKAQFVEENVRVLNEIAQACRRVCETRRPMRSTFLPAIDALSRSAYALQCGSSDCRSQGSRELQ